MRAKGLAGSIPLALILVVAPSVCRATDISGQSSSFAFSAALTGSDFRWVVDPTPWSTGSAPSPYSFSNDLSAFASGTAGQASVTTGALDATVASTVDGTAGIKSTSASSYADGLTFELGGNVVVFSANVVATNALSVQGDYGSLNVNGYADFSGASLSVFGTPYYFETVPSPNTVMYDANGLVIVANLQGISGDGVTGRKIYITALDMKFTNFAYGNEVVNGEVMFSGAEATMSAAPEPESLLALGLLALGGLAGVRRRIG